MDHPVTLPLPPLLALFLTTLDKTTPTLSPITTHTLPLVMLEHATITFPLLLDTREHVTLPLLLVTLEHATLTLPLLLVTREHATLTLPLLLVLATLTLSPSTTPVVPFSIASHVTVAQQIR